MKKHVKTCQGSSKMCNDVQNLDQVAEPSDKTKKVKKSKKDTIKQLEQLDNMLIENLDALQTKVMKWCMKKAKIYHNNVYPNAEIRFIQLGYSKEDLMAIIDYVKNVDVIMHFGGRGVYWLATTDRLMNMFEVVGNNDVRIDWENNLFNKFYDATCTGRQRVKYGCLNLLSEEKGCETARDYGVSYFIMKPEVKQRTTFVCGDSSQKQMHICTFDHFVQLMLYVETSTIHKMIKITKYRQNPDPDSDNIHVANNRNYYNYIEVQIHGDILINRDISRVMLSSCDACSYPDILDRLERDNIPYTIF